MKKLQFMAWPKLCTAVLLGAAALFMASCARDGYDDDESFQSDVYNQLLANPTEEDITISSTVDRKQTHVQWKVVNGASKYECKVYNITDGKNEVILDSLVDGVDFYIPRARDNYYRFTIHTLANTSLGNTSPEGVTTKEFNAVLEIYATIDKEGKGLSAENPIDLYEDYFKDNPIPTNLDVPDFNYNLVAGKYYKLSKALELNTYKSVMLLSNSDTEKANIIMEGDAGFEAGGEFTLEGLNITCSETSRALVTMTATPSDNLKSDKDYYIVNAININKCDINGLTGSLIYANKKDYWIVGMNIENTLIKLNTITDNLKEGALISISTANYSGIKEFIMKNCTVFQTGVGTLNYFAKYGNNARVDRPSSQWTTSDHTIINYVNNTFYKIACTWGDYSKLADYTVYDITSNIWYDCGKENNLDYIIGGRRYGTNASAKWNLNTYWSSTDGDVSATTSKDDGTKLTTDPNFVDATNGNFTPQGAEQVSNKTGDSRWLK